MADYDYGQLIDDFELGVDVMPDEDLTAYIERRRREFESKADGGSIGIEVLFTDKMKNGGRVPAVSGGFLKLLAEGTAKGKKGIMELVESGKGRFDEFVETMNQSKKPSELIDESIQVTKKMRDGPITIKMLEDMNPDTVKKLLRSEEIGLYGSQRPEALIAADMIKRFTKADGTIDYERAEFILNRKLKGNESLDELLEIEFTTRPDKIPDQGLADGGRVGLFMGGDPLTGQALSIYNSMNAYGFDDQAIANALTEQGLYTAPGDSTPDTPDTTPGNTMGLQTGSDNFSVYNPDPNSIKPFKPMGANFQNQKPNAFSTGIAKMMDNPVMKTLGFAMNPPLAFAKGILSKAGSMMPVNERSIFENLAGNQGVRVDDIGRIVNTGKYNTPEGVMAGYNLNQVTDKTFDKRTDRIEKTLSEKYGLTAEEIEDVKAGTYTGKKGFNTTMGTTTNLFSQLRNILSAKNTILGQQNIAAQMAKQQREAKAAADALAIQQSGLTDLGNIQKIQQYTGKPLSDYRMSVPASQRNYTGGSTNPNPSTPGAQDSFSNKSGMGRTGYSEGGLATMFTRRR